ncbi:MAG: helix-turn-helix domain-containing protein [Bacillota bacterium]
MEKSKENKKKYNKILGKKIRETRVAKGMNLSNLAEKISKTPSYLSQIERGLSEPSITALREISQALGVPMFYFLNDTHDHCQVVRKDNRKTLTLPDSHLSYELLSPDLSHQMEMVYFNMEPGANTCEDPLPHDGEECSFVLKGKMEIQVGGEYYTLKEGDSIYYKANIPHKITNVGDENLIFVSSITPPMF